MLLATLITRLKGMADILPGESAIWGRFEGIVREAARLFGYREIRTPLLERTELFARGVGETTDIVNKEMYTFLDKGGRSVTLRPEGTASVARALIEAGSLRPGRIERVWYLGPMFRYERPQKGRQRQFHQFGFEAVGSPSPHLDVEAVALPVRVYEMAGLADLSIKVNSVGCPQCRPGYSAALVDFFTREGGLCPECAARLPRNPLRVLDCKREGCASFRPDAPRREEHLCPGCRDHFSAVRDGLARLGIAHRVDDRLVRGLDYYTRTAFEVTSGKLGAQDALGGGGRYDGLFAELGGPAVPAVGFASGLERVMILLAGREGAFAEPAPVAVLPAAEADAPAALEAAEALRRAGIACTTDLSFRKLGHLVRDAAECGARHALVIGEAERESGQVALKDLVTREQASLPLAEAVARIRCATEGNAS